MDYSIESAEAYKWSSVTGNLNPERLSHLATFLCGKQILDAGCGGGAFAHFLAQKGYDVIGIDNHSEFLQMARQRHNDGRYVQADICNLPFANQSFDCVYCFDVLEHVDDVMALRELARVTRRRLIVAVPKRDEIMPRFGLTFFHYQDRTHLRDYTDNSLRQLVTGVEHSQIQIFPELAIPIQALVSTMLEPEQLGLKTLQRKVSHFFLRRLISQAAFKSVYEGLVAVVDF